MNADFVQLVKDEYEKLQNNKPCFYIGEGNPDADILIIGNECARREDGQDVAVHNVKKWKELLDRGHNEEDIRRELQDYNGRPDNDKYYPLFPWFGQKSIVRIMDKDGKVKRGPEGTARTWVQYQKLINWIYEKKVFDRNNFIDFHLSAFHTELSQIPMMSSGDNDQKDKTADSIQKRLDGLFSNNPFFQKFPVVIIAAGHYVRDYRIDIIGTYKVVYKGDKGESGWINLHESSDSRRLLLHTKHFAAAISNDYIKEIAILARHQIRRLNKK